MEKSKNILIVSPKASGNTYKVAEYLCVNSKADILVLENDSAINLKKYSDVVLCTGVYGDKIHADLSTWLNSIQREQFQSNVVFHVFLTWFGRGISDKKAMDNVVKYLEAKSFHYDKNYGSCYGGKLFIRKGHPNQDDLDHALKWLFQ